MLFSRARSFIICGLLPVLAASCSGGSSAPGTLPAAGPAAPRAPKQTQTVRHTYSLAAQRGYSGTVRLRSNAGAPQLLLKPNTIRACPSTVTIPVINFLPFPITIDLDAVSLKLPCSATGLFGATVVEVSPAQSVITPIKLGDATANGRLLTFTPSHDDITLPPRSKWEIIVTPETSTADVAFPINVNSPANLTANAPNLTPSNSTLSFTYTTASGGTIYNVSCFKAMPDGVLAPALIGVPLVGTPKFYCTMTPANGATFTFAGTNQFTIGNPDPDRAIIEIDGAVEAFLCSAPSEANISSCTLPPFQIGPATAPAAIKRTASKNDTSAPLVVQNFIEANLKDLLLCVPSVKNTDCNGLSGITQSTPRTVVNTGQDFDVLVADDPTYASSQPGVPSVPWSGNFTLTTSGPCRDASASEATAGPTPRPEPSPYVDVTQNGTGPGPYSEFDIKPTGAGTCSITVQEDPAYIAPQPRATPLAITIQAAAVPAKETDSQL